MLFKSINEPFVRLVLHAFVGGVCGMILGLVLAILATLLSSIVTATGITAGTVVIEPEMIGAAPVPGGVLGALFGALFSIYKKD